MISGTPGYRRGPVELTPAQPTTSVVATDGDVTAAQAGQGVMVRQGSVDFALAVPLEVAELRPKTLELIAGGDAGMVLAGEDIGMGFFLPGYRLSVFNLEGAEWVDLGDLSTSTRFEVDDPLPYVDDTGTVRVWVSTVEGAAQVDGGGPGMQVYVSATVSGVLP